MNKIFHNGGATTLWYADDSTEIAFPPDFPSRFSTIIWDHDDNLSQAANLASLLIKKGCRAFSLAGGKADEWELACDDAAIAQYEGYSVPNKIDDRFVTTTSYRGRELKYVLMEGGLNEADPLTQGKFQACLFIELGKEIFGQDRLIAEASVPVFTFGVVQVGDGYSPTYEVMDGDFKFTEELEKIYPDDETARHAAWEAARDRYFEHAEDPMKLNGYFWSNGVLMNPKGI